MKNVLLFSFFILLFSCQERSPSAPEDRKIAEAEKPIPTAEEKPPYVPVKVEVGPDDRTYVPGRRIGMITAETTPEQLTELYGADNVRADSISLGKGFKVAGYKVFPGTAAEIGVIYPNEAMRVRDLQVTIDLGSTEWKSRQNGVGIGTTVEELEEYNGHPFTFMGFDWDYAGVVTDWQGGALTDHRLRLGYDFANRDKIELHKTLVGNQKVVANNPYLDDVDVEVIQIIVRLPKW